MSFSLSLRTLRPIKSAFSPSTTQIRTKITTAASLKAKRDVARQARKKNKRSTFKDQDLTDLPQFALCDAMRYLRAFEVGRPPNSPKYELAVRLKTIKSGPTVKNRLLLPHPVRTDLRVCVIAPSDSPEAKKALAAGASMVGTTEVFEAVKAGTIDFDRCIAHESYVKELNSSGIARILGPRKLMPSIKDKTVTKDVAAAVKDLVSASEYRERMGVVRMAIGKLGFTPEEVGDNIKSAMTSMKKDIAALNDQISKDIVEVVLSSTHGPGFSLTGGFRSKTGVDPKDLAVPC